MKSNFKKLAVLGMASGALLGTQASVEAAIDVSSAVAGCGGSSTQPGPRSGCSAPSQPSYQPAQGGCAGRSQPQQPNNGCGGRSQPRPANSGCASRSQSNQPNYQANNGCGAKNQPNQNRLTADAAYEAQQQQLPNQNKWDQNSAQQQNAPQVTESELLPQLNAESKSIYQGLDADGKALALKLASQYQDKNQAVRVASQRAVERRTLNSNPAK